MPSAGIAMLAPGLVLERKYKIVQHLADGGMGAIYEAEHLTIGRRVAVKVLHAEFARKEDIVARFHQEARAASAIGHQNIVDILDLGRSVETGAHFIVMELLRGKNLADRLAELGGRMPVGRAAHIMRQVLEALAATHRHGIVHRDLKPENIYLVQRGQDPDFVKVLDFGISKVLTDDLPKMSTTGAVLGTPYFMSPEQTRGAATDHRVDIYACGAILYQLVTGRLPFTAPNFNALMFEIAGGRYYPPRALSPEIPASFEQVVQYAMALDPNYRFQTAEHMAQSVAPFAPAIAAAGPANEEYESKTPSALSAFLPPPPDGGVAPVLMPPASVARAQTLSPPQRSRALPITIGAGVAVGLFAGLVVIRQMDRGSVEARPVPTAASAAPAASAAGGAPGPELAGAPVTTPLGVVDAGAAAAAPAPAAEPAAPPVEVAAPAAAAPPDAAVVVVPAPEMIIEMSPDPIAKAPAPAPVPTPTPTKPAPVVPAPVPAVVAPAPAPAPAMATLTVQVTPADAPGLVVVVDGSAISGNAITLPANARKKLKVVVKAKGYADWTQRVAVGADTTLDVKLSRKSLGDKGPGGALGL